LIRVAGHPVAVFGGQRNHVGVRDGLRQHRVEVEAVRLSLLSRQCFRLKGDVSALDLLPQ
jgi:hypothetical protein